MPAWQLALTFYTARTVCVTIFSTGGEIPPCFNFYVVMALTLVARSYALFIRWMRGKLKGEMPASNQIRELELQHLGNHKPSPHLYLPHRDSFGAITLLTLKLPLYRDLGNTL